MPIEVLLDARRWLGELWPPYGMTYGQVHELVQAIRRQVLGTPALSG